MAVYRVLADAVLALHIGVVLFVVGGLVAIVVGHVRHWRAVDRLWFRLVHLGAIAFVVLESWFGMACPLTTLEMDLRGRTRGATYDGGFVAHWLRGLLYFDAPAWVFSVAYSVFGALVVATWWRFPLQSGRRSPPSIERSPLPPGEG